MVDAVDASTSIVTEIVAAPPGDGDGDGGVQIPWDLLLVLGGVLAVVTVAPFLLREATLFARAARPTRERFREQFGFELR